MHVFKWTNPQFYLCFDNGSDGAAAPVSGGDGGSSVPAASSAGDGGGLAPDASPASTSEPAPSATSEPSPWANLGSNDDLDHPEIPQIAPVVPPVAPVVPPVATPPAQPTAQPQAPQPGQPGAPTPGAPAEPVAAPLSPSDPVGIAAAIEQNRDAVIAHLAETKFALSEADIQELDTDVTKAVPKLLARAFMESQIAMQRFLAQSVPGMIEKFQTVTKANGDAESKFFDAHKALGLDPNNAQHRATASRFATIYRQANPGIKLDQLIAEVGPMVAASLRVQPGAPAPQIPGAPAAGPRGGTPFRPAVNGGGGAPPVPEPANQWAGLGQDFE